MVEVFVGPTPHGGPPSRGKGSTRKSGHGLPIPEQYQCSVVFRPVRPNDAIQDQHSHGDVYVYQIPSRKAMGIGHEQRCITGGKKWHNNPPIPR